MGLTSEAISAVWGGTRKSARTARQGIANETAFRRKLAVGRTYVTRSDSAAPIARRSAIVRTVTVTIPAPLRIAGECAAFSEGVHVLVFQDKAQSHGPSNLPWIHFVRKRLVQLASDNLQLHVNFARLYHPSYGYVCFRQPEVIAPFVLIGVSDQTPASEKNVQEDDLATITAEIHKTAKGIAKRNQQIIKMIDEYRARWKVLRVAVRQDH